MRLPLLLAAVALTGCEPIEKTREVEPYWLDYRVDVPEPPEGGFQMASPIIELPPYTEAQLCHYGTYEGPDVGVVYMAQYTDDQLTHHTGPQAVFDQQYEDGELVDCKSQGSGDMPVYPSLFGLVGMDLEGGGPPLEGTGNGFNAIDLPEGIAFPLSSGQRYAMDLHWINFNPDPARTNSAVNLGLVPADEVEAWAAVALFDAGPVDVPPGEYEYTFDCEFQEDYDVLSILGHMHAWGSEYTVEHIKPDGTSRVVYYEPDWQPIYATWPDLSYYPPGELSVERGDIFRTTCKWNNTSSETLTNFKEMCGSDMVMSPMEEPIVCISGEYL